MLIGASPQFVLLPIVRADPALDDGVDLFLDLLGKRLDLGVGLRALASICLLACSTMESICSVMLMNPPIR